MTQQPRKRPASLQLGLLFWALVFLVHMGLGYYAHTSVAFALFPTWAVPLAYVAFVLATWALGLALLILFVLLRPWLR